MFCMFVYLTVRCDGCLHQHMSESKDMIRTITVTPKAAKKGEFYATEETSIEDYTCPSCEQKNTSTKITMQNVDALMQMIYINRVTGDQQNVNVPRRKDATCIDMPRYLVGCGVSNKYFTFIFSSLYLL